MTVSSRRVAAAIAVGLLATVGLAVAAASAQNPGVSCIGEAPDAEGRVTLECVIPVPPAVTVTTPVPTTVTVTQTVTQTATSTPTTTPPPSSPTATVSPTPTTAPDGCMPQPSACGWPDETNTGVPDGVTLRVRQGDYTARAGEVIDGMDIRGCLIIAGDNVTVRNSRIGADGDCPWYVVRSFGRTGVLIEDTEIVLSGWQTKGIAFDGYTARRVHFHGGADCAHTGRDVTIQDSFCDIPAAGAIGSAHIDGFQSDGGRNITLRHNTIRVPYSQTAAILMSTNTSPITDVTIVDNLVAGGGYSIYCGTDTGGAVRGTLTFSGNVVARTYFPNGGRWGPTTSCPSSGWRWDG